jgi:hypothetical protein
MIAQQVGASQLRPCRQGGGSDLFEMRFALLLSAAGLLALAAPLGAQAVSLEEACGKFAGKLSAAQAAGNTQKAQTIYQKGSARIASKFNGASCPNVKPPTP